MEEIPFKGRPVPIISKGQITSQTDQSRFLTKNRELENDLDADDSQSKETPRKSELVEIQTSSSRILYKVISIFPFDLFPDELVIDEIKVSITYKGLITRQVSSILIKDITDILYFSTLIFASLRIKGGEFTDEKQGPMVMAKLWPKDAKMARRIILGLMIFSDQKVDSTQMTVSEIIAKTSELGKSRDNP